MSVEVGNLSKLVVHAELQEDLKKRHKLFFCAYLLDLLKLCYSVFGTSEHFCYVSVDKSYCQCLLAVQI